MKKRYVVGNDKGEVIAWKPLPDEYVEGANVWRAQHPLVDPLDFQQMVAGIKHYPPSMLDMGLPHIMAFDSPEEAENIIFDRGPPGLREEGLKIMEIRVELVPVGK